MISVKQNKLPKCTCWWCSDFTPISI